MLDNSDALVPQSGGMIYISNRCFFSYIEKKKTKLWKIKSDSGEENKSTKIELFVIFMPAPCVKHINLTRALLSYFSTSNSIVLTDYSYYAVNLC